MIDREWLLLLKGCAVMQLSVSGLGHGVGRNALFGLCVCVLALVRSFSCMRISFRDPSWEGLIT